MAYEARIIRRSALNDLNKFDVPIGVSRTRSKEGFAEVPPTGDIRPMTAQSSTYWLRVGGFSVLFHIDHQQEVSFVDSIGPPTRHLQIARHVAGERRQDNPVIQRSCRFCSKSSSAVQAPRRVSYAVGTRHCNQGYFCTFPRKGRCAKIPVLSCKLGGIGQSALLFHSRLTKRD